MRILARLLAAVLFFTLAVDASAAEAATKPSAPRSVKATPANKAVKVSWVAPSSNGGAKIDKYAVQRWKPSTEQWITVKSTSGSARSWTNTGLTNGTKYYFRVAAHNRLGWSKVSGQASATPRTVPAAPYKFQADLHPTALGARWGAPTTTGGAPIDFYLVEISTDGATWTTPKKTPVIGTFNDPLKFTGLVPGGRYWLRARAHNAAGYSASTGSGPYKVYAPPLAVRDLAALSSSGQVALTWRGPLSDGETGDEDGLPAAVSYEVKTSADGGTTWSAPVVRTSPSYTATGLTNGVDHQFQVTAKGTSKIGLGAPTIIAPGAPTGLPTVPTNVGLNWRLPEAGNVLTWAPPVNDGGFDLVRYEAQHWNEGTPPPYDVTTFSPDAASAPAPFAETDTMHIRACNGPDDSDCGPWSADIGPIPGFVTNPTIEATGSTVSLDWDPPTNVGVAVTNYSVGRSTDGGVTWSELGTTTDTAYEDDTAAFATSYRYRIIANGADGSGGWAPLDVTTDPHELGVSTAAIQVTENGGNTFEVTLDPVATGDTTITVETSNALAAVSSTPTVTVPLGQTSATVTIDGVDDLDFAAESVTITLTYGTQTKTVAVTVLDDDLPEFVLSETPVTVDVDQTTPFMVSLPEQPTEDVTVSIVSENPATATVSVSSRIFTPLNWNAPQSVGVTGVSPGSTTVSLTALGYTPGTVSVTVEEAPIEP